MLHRAPAISRLPSLCFPYCTRHRTRSSAPFLFPFRGRNCSWNHRYRWLVLIWRGRWVTLPCCLWILHWSMSRWGRWKYPGLVPYRFRSIRYINFDLLCTSCRTRSVALLFSPMLRHKHLLDIFLYLFHFCFVFDEIVWWNSHLFKQLRSKVHQIFIRCALSVLLQFSLFLFYLFCCQSTSPTL